MMDQIEISLPRDSSPPAPAPVPSGERIAAIDTLRGVAVLGILLINILSFGLPSAAENNPAAAGEPSRADIAFWFASQLLVEGKMRALFSMLFGASVLLLTDRLRARAAEDLADIYYRRTLWLALFGYLHLTYLWEGDILFTYGAVGVVLFLFRRLSARALAFAGTAVLAVAVLIAALDNRALRELRDRAEVAGADVKPTEEMRHAFDEWEERRKEFQPSEEDIRGEKLDRLGGYAANQRRRQSLGEGYASRGEFVGELLDAAGMMLVGMGLFRWGVLSARRGFGVYVLLVVGGYGLGIPLAWWTASQERAAGFDPTQISPWVPGAYQPERLAVALGHVGAVMLVCKAGLLPRVRAVLAAVGRMALTNYLMQTVLCTSVFYGYGLGLFGRLGRAELLWVVAAVWFLELTWSPLWLSCFQFGPAEYLWRWLTYLSRPPLLRSRGAPSRSD